MRKYMAYPRTFPILLLAAPSADQALSFQILQVPVTRYRSGILFILFDLKTKIISFMRASFKWLTFELFSLLPIFVWSDSVFGIEFK